MYKTLDNIEGLDDKLYNSVSLALENMAFVSIEKAPQGYERDKNGEYLNGCIWLKTAFAMYSLELLVREDFLENITAGIAVPGTESESENSGIMIDVLLELANTIGGSIMRSMEQIIGTFTLEMPEFEIGREINPKAFIKEEYIADGEYPITVAITKI